jgi:hypothetical protein
MPRLPIDYSKTIIYKICCNDVNIKEIYVGHTTDLIRRRRHHKSHINNEKSKEYNQYKYQFIRENGLWDNWDLVPIEVYPCNDVNEARIRERYWIEQLKAELNKVIPSRTHKEYRELNDEQIKEKKRDSYQQNREVICKKVKEWREQNKEKKAEMDKNYVENNKEKVKERKKHWYENNKERLNEKSKEKYENKKEFLKEKINCDCGCSIRKDSLLRHFKSKKHQNYLTTVNENGHKSTP